MLSRQCELVHRRYTTDQGRLLYHRSTRVAGEPPVRSGFSPKPTPPVGLYGENSSGVGVRVGERGAAPYSPGGGLPRVWCTSGVSIKIGYKVNPCNQFILKGCGGGIRTRDLWVMSPTSYRTAPPRVAARITDANMAFPMGSTNTGSMRPVGRRCVVQQEDELSRSY